VTLRFSPDLDETALPADVRTAYDRGLQETGAELDVASIRAKKALAIDDASPPGEQRMARLQAAIDDSFSGLRAPCARLTDKQRLVRAPSPPSGPHEEPKTAVAAAPGLAPTPASGDAAGLADAWPASQQLQVGVFQRDGAPGETTPSLLSQLPAETSGPPKRAAAAGQDGPVRHIALVGPFVTPTQARAYCDKLTVKGGDCAVRLTSTLNGSKKPTAAVKLAKVRAPAPRNRGPAAAHRPLAQTPPLVQASLSSRLRDLQASLRGRLTE
jgi:hypothetical protein